MENTDLIETLIVVSCVVFIVLALDLANGLLFCKKGKRSTSSEKNPIVVIVAMEIEFEDLLKKLENTNITSISKYKFYEGTINDYPVVICHCRVNEINAAIVTLMAIQKYHPIAIINEGTAGGYGESIHKNDIVIGTSAINLASVKTPQKKKGEGSNSLEWTMIGFFDDDEGNRKDFQKADENLVNLAKKIEYKNGTVHFGVVGSSDNWNSEADRILWLNKELGALCEEMECISIYTVANNFNIPVIGIKVISNNDMINESFDTSTALSSQTFTYDLILKIISEY